MKQLVVEKASMERTRNPSSIISSNSGGSNKDTDEDMASKVYSDLFCIAM
jgi:hypothetical protein